MVDGLRAFGELWPSFPSWLLAAFAFYRLFRSELLRRDESHQAEIARRDLYITTLETRLEKRDVDIDDLKEKNTLLIEKIDHMADEIRSLKDEVSRLRRYGQERDNL